MSAAHWSLEQYTRLLETGANDSSRRLVLVIEPVPGHNSTSGEEGKSAIVGFLVARGLGAEWELENLVVEAAARRRGIGTKLLAELIVRARAAGGQSVFLEVRHSNSAARALYRSAGFSEAGRRRGYYANPIEDAVVYSLVLVA